MDKTRIERELYFYNKVNEPADKETIMKVMECFYRQGHSGFSAGYLINYMKFMVKDTVNAQNKLTEMLKHDTDGSQKLITENILSIWNLLKDEPKDVQNICIKLMDYEPITPLQGTDDEWVEVYKNEEKKCYQNMRCSAVFKDVFKNGIEIAYYLDAQYYTDNGGVTFFNTNRFGRKEITFPYEPKQEKVYIYEPIEGGRTYFITNPLTIEKVKKEYIKEVKKDEILGEYIEKHKRGLCNCNEDTKELCIGGLYLNGEMSKEDLFNNVIDTTDLDV